MRVHHAHTHSQVFKHLPPGVYYFICASKQIENFDMATMLSEADAASEGPEEEAGLMEEKEKEDEKNKKVEAEEEEEAEEKEAEEEEEEEEKREDNTIFLQLKEKESKDNNENSDGDDGDDDDDKEEKRLDENDNEDDDDGNDGDDSDGDDSDGNDDRFPPSSITLHNGVEIKLIERSSTSLSATSPPCISTDKTSAPDECLVLNNY